MQTANLDIVRMCRFAPYLKGKGPTFTLTLYDPHLPQNGRSQYPLGYVLRMDGVILFRGEDYGCSPLHCIDSDASVEGVMSFLTLRPGDTDRDYFADYTPEQLAYCAEHAEALSCYIVDRFGERPDKGR